MRDLLTAVDAERLTLADYLADFDQHFWQTGPPGFWKLERQQHFQEPGYDSWEAFARGDWEESLRLLEGHRHELEVYHQRIADHGFAVKRVRVVQEPIIPYLQWELHLLRLREECGSGVRVVGPEHVAPYEATSPLPEVCTLGSKIMYEVLYDERGVLDGARRYTDPELISRWQRLIAGLYAAGEPLESYFGRKVASLPPPTTTEPMT